MWNSVGLREPLLFRILPKDSESFREHLWSFSQQRTRATKGYVKIWAENRNHNDHCTKFITWNTNKKFQLGFWDLKRGVLRGLRYAKKGRKVCTKVCPKVCTKVCTKWCPKICTPTGSPCQYCFEPLRQLVNTPDFSPASPGSNPAGASPVEVPF